MPRNIAPTIDWESIQNDFPCPDELWQGIWGEVGDICGKGWDTWSATYSALSAVCGRSMHWHYVGASMFGMSYTLNLAPTGSGKEFPINIVGALLPDDYNRRDAVQSGPALYPILANLESREKVKPAVPTILILPEFTKMLHLANIQHSTLIDMLDSIYHTANPTNMSRSDRDASMGAGGDRLCAPPTLSIYAVTTPENMLTVAGDHLSDNGFLNRYLILPGPTKQWEFMPRGGGRAAPQVTLKRLRDKLTEMAGRVWGNGASYIDAFSQGAIDLMVPWGEKLFTPIQAQSGSEWNRKKRVHSHFHHIALISAWSKGNDLVSVDDVKMAMTVAEASLKFIDVIWANVAIPTTTMETGDAMLERLVIAKVEQRQNHYTKDNMREAFRRSHPNLNRIKVRKAIIACMADGIILLVPETMCYITKAHAEAINLASKSHSRAKTSGILKSVK